MNTLDRIETSLVDVVSKIAPWCAPIPTAFLVGRATILYLAWPWPVALVAAIIIECLGLSATSTALTLYEYNQARRKNDSGAPFGLALALVMIYFAVATGLTVALDIFPTLARYAPAIFPTLSLTGITVLALRGDHKRRIAVIENERLERKANRQTSVKKASIQPTIVDGKVKEFTALLDLAKAGRKAAQDARIDRLLDVYRDDPFTGPTEAGRMIGVSRQTVHSYLTSLEKSGRIHKNGNGVEILEV